MADRTLFPRAFGLRTPTPLWTAPAFDRCLLLALLYPAAMILIMWTVSGHVGPAEHTLLLRSGVPGWERAGMPIGIAAAWYCLRRYQRSTGWATLMWWIIDLPIIVILVAAGAGAVVVGIAFINIGTGIGILACIVAGFFVFSAFSNAPRIGSRMGCRSRCDIRRCCLCCRAADYLNKRCALGRWQGQFQAAPVAVLIAACIVAAGVVASHETWLLGGPVLLFLGLLTLLKLTIRLGGARTDPGAAAPRPRTWRLAPLSPGDRRRPGRRWCHCFSHHRHRF